jgi:hypothetical protein
MPGVRNSLVEAECRSPAIHLHPRATLPPVFDVAQNPIQRMTAELGSLDPVQAAALVLHILRGRRKRGS